MARNEPARSARRAAARNPETHGNAESAASGSEPEVEATGYAGSPHDISPRARRKTCVLASFLRVSTILAFGIYIFKYLTRIFDEKEGWREGNWD